MSWFRKIFSSNNVALEAKFKYFIRLKTQMVLSRWNLVAKKVFKFNYKIYDTYLKKKRKITIIFEQDEYDSDNLGYFDNASGTLYVYPENFVTKNYISSLNAPNAVNVISSVAYHEATHGIDPTTKQEGFNEILMDTDFEEQRGNDDAYYKSWHEFNAFCQEISYLLSTIVGTDENKKEELRGILRNNDVTELKILLGPNFDDFLKSIDTSQSKSRILKQRIINSLKL